MKGRWFNYRPLLLIFIFLLLGSLFAFYISAKTLLCVIISISVLALLVVIAVLKKKLSYIIIPIISLAVGVGAYSLAVLPFRTNKFAIKPEHIQARVFYRDKANDSSVRVYADNCVIDGEEHDFNLTIYIYDNDNLYSGIEIGSVLSFKVLNFYKNDIFKSEIPNSKYYVNDLQYVVSCTMDNLQVIDNDKTFAELIKSKIYDNLGKGLTNENVELAYSSLFGDKAMLGDTQQEAFKLSGVAHLLAVSGLHVGIIVKILMFVMKKMDNRKWLRLGIIASLLLFYAYICDFSSSVVRASIMSVVLLMAPIMFRRYDTMSAISLAGIICFLVNPLSVYDISFLMSFSCVIGIAILYKPIKKFMTSTKAPKWLADSISISTATMVALTIIMAYFFKNLNVISIIANILIIPIFTVCFTMFFVLSFASLILPFITYTLYLINPILDFITLLAGMLGNLNISNFATANINYFSIVLYFLFLMLAGRFCVAKQENKFLITVPMITLLVIGIVI